MFYVFDPNCIKGVPIKSRHKEELLRAYQIVYKCCEVCAVKPQLHKMDTETSKDVEEFINDVQQTKLQYTTQDRHCHPAEKAGQTSKATFKSILAFLSKQFQIADWCRLLTQTDLTAVPPKPFAVGVGGHGRRAALGRDANGPTRIRDAGASKTCEAK